MPYQVIARRWRPKIFDAVVGQRHVTETLRNALAGDRLAHALLFAGPRGVGKTTTARILARGLNCAQGPTPTPCGTCPACLEIEAGHSLDCIEVDAASNTQVEKTRDLLETVQYAPARGRHKIYIIDEAHMLSLSSFNALLKTLEEPPPRVLFVLATTEPHKIPATIHSRCQRHDFRLLSPPEITARLAEIAAADEVAADPQALAVLAQAAAGSLRDGQTLLDHAIACLGPRLEAAAVADLLGLAGAEVLAEAADAILRRDAAALLGLVDRLARHGHDLRQFALELSAHLRDLLVQKLCPDPGPLLEGARVPPEVRAAQAAQAAVPELELMLRTLGQTESEMRRAGQPRLWLEMALLRLTEIRRLQGLDEILGRLVALEGRLEGSAPSPPPSGELPLFPSPAPPPAPPKATPRGSSPAPPAPPSTPPRTAPPAPLSTRDPDAEAGRASDPRERRIPSPEGRGGAEAASGGAGPPEPPPAPRPQPRAAVDAEVGWSSVLERLKGRKRLASVLTEARPAELLEDRLALAIPNGNSYVRETLEDPETRRVLAEAVTDSFGRRLRLEYRFVAAPAAPPDGPGGSPAAAGRLRDHPTVREAVAILGGTVIREVAG